MGLRAQERVPGLSPSLALAVHLCDGWKMAWVDWVVDEQTNHGSGGHVSVQEVSLYRGHSSKVNSRVHLLILMNLQTLHGT
jgi:hypothetical protein